MSTCLDVIYVTMKRNNRVGLSRLSIIPRGRRLVGTRTPPWRRQAKNSGLIKGEVHTFQKKSRSFTPYVSVVFFFFFFEAQDILDNIITGDESKNFFLENWNNG